MSSAPAHSFSVPSWTASAGTRSWSASPTSSTASPGASVKSDWVTTAPRTDKPWGHEELFALVDGRYAGKTIHVTQGHALSLQFHERKEETISVFSGRL